jgi:hypothetical protein
MEQCRGRGGRRGSGKYREKQEKWQRKTGHAVKRKKKITYINNKYILKGNEVEINKSTQSKIIKAQKK